MACACVVSTLHCNFTIATDRAQKLSCFQKNPEIEPLAHSWLFCRTYCDTGRNRTNHETGECVRLVTRVRDFVFRKTHSTDKKAGKALINLLSKTRKL